MSVQINAVTTLEVDDRIAVVAIDNPPVNALSAVVRQGLAEAVTRLQADSNLDAIVLLCGGRTFFAGADITELGKPAVEPTLRQLQLAIENSTKPVIAAIHGTALGGGLELAMVAHYRVAVPSARFGLPEVNLGILPGAGGTQRLPRLVGVPKALEMVTSGSQIGAAEAAATGLVDALAEEGRLREGALAFARRIVADNLPLVKVRDRREHLDEALADPELFAKFRKANEKKFRGFKAPEANIRCIEIAVSEPSFDAALQQERALFDSLVSDSQSAALRHVFFAERDAVKLRDVPPDLAIPPVASVAVIGAGTMGGGIAMNFLAAGMPVTLVETNEAALTRGVEAIRRNYEGAVSKGKLKPAELEARMALITPALDFAAVSQADLIIEAVFELMEVKHEVFRKLDAVAKPGAILASNTSYLDIEAIGGVTSRPDHVLGLHFFSPANVMKLVEVVRTSKTAPAVLAAAMAVVKRIGKLGVTVGNGFGFVGNRMLFARSAQADQLVLDGATPWAVDKVLYDFGFPMGQYQMRDLAGLDVGWDRTQSRSATVREILNEMGRHGQKSGSGYYDYDDNRQAVPSQVVMDVVEAFAARQGIARREVAEQEIADRILLAMVNEGARILEEGIARTSSDIDVVWLAGYGWPRYRGGPMFWADLQGIAQVRNKLAALAHKHGDAFKPAKLIEELAVQGARFQDVVGGQIQKQAHA